MRLWRAMGGSKPNRDFHCVRQKTRSPAAIASKWIAHDFQGCNDVFSVAMGHRAGTPIAISNGHRQIQNEGNVGPPLTSGCGQNNALRRELRPMNGASELSDPENLYTQLPGNGRGRGREKSKNVETTGIVHEGGGLPAHVRACAGVRSQAATRGDASQLPRFDF